MKQGLLLLLAATSLTVAAPAMAQSIDARQATVDARIDAGVRDRSLTPGEAAQLRAEFADIARQEARYRRSGHTLTRAERADLDQRFDRLSVRIKSDRHDNDGRGGGGAINERQRELDAKIDAGVRAGGLTANEAATLRAEYRSIAQQEARYRASGRELTPAERAVIDQRLDRLERQISRNRADDDRRWSNLDRRQASFDQKLDQAVRDRRVSAREAARLRTEFRGIARLEAQYRRSRPGITANERADLNRRFDRMEANFRASTTPNSNLFDLLLGLTG